MTRVRPKPLCLMELVPVEQAVGERVLAGQVRADAQVPGGLTGQRRVVMVPSTDWTRFICRANLLAGLPTAWAAASAA